MDLGKLEYRVRSVTRYVVTRFHEDASGGTGSSDPKGEFDNYETAYAVAYALCKEEHDRLGLPSGDERIKYPETEKLRPGAIPHRRGCLGSALVKLDNQFP